MHKLIIDSCQHRKLVEAVKRASEALKDAAWSARSNKDRSEYINAKVALDKALENIINQSQEA